MLANPARYSLVPVIGSSVELAPRRGSYPLERAGEIETTPTWAVEDCLIELFQSLAIARTHIAAGQLVPGDWLGLAARYPERVASLTLVSPRPRSELRGLESRLLVVAGDKGLSAQGPAKLLADLPSAAAHILRGYECLPWADVIAERGANIAPSPPASAGVRSKRGAVHEPMGSLAPGAGIRATALAIEFDPRGISPGESRGLPKLRL
jgi:hypothetical protein